MWVVVRYTFCNSIGTNDISLKTRADMIDFIDRVLRVYSGNMRFPFGGKQLLLVCDVYQLEPVVTSDMRDILSRFSLI